MFDRTRLSRLITLALASCAVTWAFAARRVRAPRRRRDHHRPSRAPAFKVVPGDTNKAPSATTGPAFQAAAGDTAKTPDRAASTATSRARRHRQQDPGAGRRRDGRHRHIALILAIAAILAALGAVTLTITRTQPSGRGRLRPSRPLKAPGDTAGGRRETPARLRLTGRRPRSVRVTLGQSRPARLVPCTMRPDLERGKRCGLSMP